MAAKDYSRKGFFSEFAKHFRHGIATHLDRKLGKVLDAPIRPPGALDELEFLSACTRCNACAEACPHHAIQRLPLQAGVAANTPVIEPRTQACLLCEDFPCIAACDDEALLPLGQQRPSMGRARIETDHCQTYDDKVCTLCYDACPYPEDAITLGEDFHPRILDACVGCGQCEQRCPVHPSGVRAMSPIRFRARELEDDDLFGYLDTGEDQSS